MDDTRTKKLHGLLERLGRAIRRSVADSDDVNSCLAELRADGWDAVMFLEAALGCRNDVDFDPDDDALRIHVGRTHRGAEYRIDSADARWLASLGISPSRHRSQPQHALGPLNQPFPSSGDEG